MVVHAKNHICLSQHYSSSCGIMIIYNSSQAESFVTVFDERPFGLPLSITPYTWYIPGWGPTIVWLSTPQLHQSCAWVDPSTSSHRRKTVVHLGQPPMSVTKREGNSMIPRHKFMLLWSPLIPCHYSHKILRNRFLLFAILYFLPTLGTPCCCFPYHEKKFRGEPKKKKNSIRSKIWPLS